MTNKHTKYDLKQMQSVPLQGKITMTKLRIQQWYEHWDGQVYVSFSGGKDSTVLKHIVDSMYDDVPAVFVNTGLEYPEIQKFATSQKNVMTVRPEIRFDEVIEKYGYPVISKEIANIVRLAKNVEGNTRWQKLHGEYLTSTGKKSSYNCEKWRFLLDAPFKVSEKCCDVMKKNPAKKYEKETGRKPFIGMMASESRKREFGWMKTGCNAFEVARPSSSPMAFWTEQDVLEYIVKFNLDYAKVYGEIRQDESGKYYTTGVDRTGCIFCMFGCHLEKEPNRFQRLKETHQRQYEYCIGGGEMVESKWQPNRDGLGLGKVLDYIGVKY